MPKDYARYVPKTKRPLPKQGWRKRLWWVFIAGMLLAIFLSGIFYYRQHQESFNLLVGQIKTIFMKAPKVKDKTVTVNPFSPQNAQPDSEIQFSFYTDLPAMQVAVRPAVTPEPIPAKSINLIKTPSVPEKKSVNSTAATPMKPQAEKFLLQIAAFRNPTAAGEMRITLLLSGFEVEVVKAVNNNQQLYQVQQGPYQSITQAKSMQRELKKKGIDSVIVKKIE